MNSIAKLLWIAFLICLVFAVCSCQETFDQAPQSAENIYYAQSERFDGGGGGMAQGTVKNMVMPESSRQVIRGARVAVKVSDYTEARKKIKQFAEENGGFVFRSSQQREKNDDLSGTIVVKIPQEHYNAALEFFSALGKVYELTEEAEDVSDNVADLGLRIKNSRKLEERILAILADQTGSISDVLEAERELARVRERIEKLEGQKNGILKRVKYATFTLNLFVSSSKSVEIRTWYGPLLQDLRELGFVLTSSLGALLKVLVGVLPWLLLIFVGLRWRRRYKLRKSQSASTDKK